MNSPGVGPAERARRGITDARRQRLSIGLADPADLIAALEPVLARAIRAGLDSDATRHPPPTARWRRTRGAGAKPVT